VAVWSQCRAFSSIVRKQTGIENVIRACMGIPRDCYEYVSMKQRRIFIYLFIPAAVRQQSLHLVHLRLGCTCTTPQDYISKQSFCRNLFIRYQTCEQIGGYLDCGDCSLYFWAVQEDPTKVQQTIQRLQLLTLIVLTNKSRFY
jgi:hypothetical protein